MGYYYDSNNLLKITDITYLPKLLELLKVAKLNRDSDEFDRLEPAVTEALMNMGYMNEENLHAVKKGCLNLLSKIKE
ncbi:hypothetical protein [Pedobacter jamesrossensis]|uniref:Uncharacterized protein n=1 Tax=Pedobacter jamesrossensis TaxID=1908238 RepID=A0ABV8NPB5_9SPHI